MNIIILCFLASIVFVLAYNETEQSVPIQKSDVEYERRLKIFPRGSGAHSVYRLSSRGAPSLELTDIIYKSDGHNTIPIVNEEYNLLFFRVAKGGSTEWTRLLMRLERNEKWCAKGDIHPPEIHRLKLLSDYPIEVAQEMMTSQNWTKAIFVRNPKKRILSAFLDKSISHRDEFKTRFCKTYALRIGKTMGRPRKKQLHNKSYKTCQNKHEEFDFFLYNITTVLDDNVHWRSSFSFVDRKWWPYIDYIANMEDISEDAEDLLKSLISNIDGVSAWDRAGKTGWPGKNCREENGAFMGIKRKNHATNAPDKMLIYYTPELERYVEKRYVDDYNNPFFRFKRMKLFREGNEDVEAEEVDINQ